MLSRRHLRVKVLQAVYAFKLSGYSDVTQGEKLLQSSLDKLYELYINQVAFLIELTEYARLRIEDAKLKFFPTEAESNPNMRFADNRLIMKISENRDFRKNYDKYHVNLVTELEIIKRVFGEIRELKEYKEYMDSPKDSFTADRNFISTLIKVYFSENESLEDYYEDKNIFWAADYEIALMMIIKTIKAFEEDSLDIQKLPGLFDSDEEQAKEDKLFLLNLYRKTINHEDEYELLISSTLDNWELERIALMDNLLIRMAICELQEFPSIPVKVTLNEYIEIAKYFSTPRSSVFINGILDKLVEQLKTGNKISKKGRGLME